VRATHLASVLVLIPFVIYTSYCFFGPPSCPVVCSRRLLMIIRFFSVRPSFLPSFLIGFDHACPMLFLSGKASKQATQLGPRVHMRRIRTFSYGHFGHFGQYLDQNKFGPKIKNVSKFCLGPNLFSMSSNSFFALVRLHNLIKFFECFKLLF
jgi:hypothetical protein